MPLDRFSSSPIIREFLALSPQEQFTIRVLVEGLRGQYAVQQEPRQNPERDRALAMLLADKSATVPAVARTVGVHTQTLYRWAEAAGIDVHVRAPKPGTRRSRRPGEVVLRGLRAATCERAAMGVE